ncbi:recombinase family protein [Streptosporangium roseum]|uniref:recombinase family protein n=1 Tax=Streptosporangium roseum TaxID=2001 RepID=UPI003323F415
MATRAPTRWGYARLSPRLPDHMEVKALAEAGCGEVVVETAGPRADRPQLRGLLQRTRPGDSLVVSTPNSMAVSIKELLAIVNAELAPRGITLEILSGAGAGLHRPAGQETAGYGLFLLAAMAAQMERATVRELTRQGSAAAAARGRKGGRPSALSAQTLALARERLADGESVTAIARDLKVGRSTLYRALEGENRP